MGSHGTLSWLNFQMDEKECTLPETNSNFCTWKWMKLEYDRVLLGIAIFQGRLLLVLGSVIKGILATPPQSYPPKATPPKNKALLRVY